MEIQNPQRSKTTTEFFGKMVAEKMEIPYESIKEVIDFAWKSTREALSDPQVRSIQITGLAILHFNARRGRKRIKQLLKNKEHHDLAPHEEEELLFFEERCRDFDEKHKYQRRDKSHKGICEPNTQSTQESQTGT